MGSRAPAPRPRRSPRPPLPSLPPLPPLPSLSSLRTALVASQSTHAFAAVPPAEFEIDETCMVCFEPVTKTGLVDVGCGGLHRVCPNCLEAWCTQCVATSSEVRCPMCKRDIWQNQSLEKMNEALTAARAFGTDARVRAREKGVALKALVRRILPSHWSEMAIAYKNFRERLVTWIQAQDASDDLWTALRQSMAKCVELEESYVKKMWLPWLEVWASTPTEIESRERASGWDFRYDSSALVAFDWLTSVRGLWGWREYRNPSEPVPGLYDWLQLIKHPRRVPDNPAPSPVENGFLYRRLQTVEPPWARWAVGRTNTVPGTVPTALSASGLGPHTRIVLTSPVELWNCLHGLQRTVAGQWRAWATAARESALRAEVEANSRASAGDLTSGAAEILIMGTDGRSGRYAKLLSTARNDALSMDEWRAVLNETPFEVMRRERYARRQTLLRRWYREDDSASLDVHHDVLVIGAIETALKSARDGGGPSSGTSTPFEPVSFMKELPTTVSSALKKCKPPWTSWRSHEMDSFLGPDGRRWKAWRDMLDAQRPSLGALATAADPPSLSDTARTSSW